MPRTPAECKQRARGKRQQAGREELGLLEDLLEDAPSVVVEIRESATGEGDDAPV